MGIYRLIGTPIYKRLISLMDVLISRYLYKYVWARSISYVRHHQTNASCILIIVLISVDMSEMNAKGKTSL